jgi:hypothetical protein
MCVSPTVTRPGSANDSIAGLAHQLSLPVVTFHGAPRTVVQSIVRYGFLLPGAEIGRSGIKLGVRCGSTFGAGIYSSPDPKYASSYTTYGTGEIALARPSDVPGMRLVICATLMGRPLDATRQQAHGVTRPVNEKAHSHVSMSGLEYIVFDSAQIIPCYVLHLDYGAEQAQRDHDKLMADPIGYFARRAKRKREDPAWSEWYNSSPGAVQRKKEALKAAAAKWFPYGYGPAKGTSFVIEDMAGVSDDEEDFGDFQYQRMEQEDEIRSQRLHKGGSWFDEYQMVRKSHKDLDMESKR